VLDAELLPQDNGRLQQWYVLPRCPNSLRTTCGSTRGIRLPPNKELNFIDAGEAGIFASEALQWAVENGIITGDGRINSKGLATRAQVTQMLMRYLKGMEEK